MEEKERYLDEFGDLDEKLVKQRENVNLDLEKMQDKIEQEMEKRLDEREAEMATDNLMTRMGNGPTIRIPEPVNKEVELSKSIAGDEEYWL